MGQPETLPLPPMSHFTTCGSVFPQHQYNTPAMPWHLADTMDFLFSPQIKEQGKDMSQTLSPSANENTPDREYQISKENRQLAM